MATETKTLRLQFEATTTPATDALKAVQKELKGTGVALDSLKTSISLNDDGVRVFTHDVKLLSDSLTKLDSVQKGIQVKLDKIPGTTTKSDITGELKGSFAAQARESIQVARSTAAEQTAIAREGANSIIAIKVQASERQRQIELDLQSKLKELQQKYIEGTLNRGLPSSIVRITESYQKSIVQLNLATDARIKKVREQAEAERLAARSMIEKLSQDSTFKPKTDYGNALIKGMTESGIKSRLDAEKKAAQELEAIQKADVATTLQLQEYLNSQWITKLRERAAKRKELEAQAIAEQKAEAAAELAVMQQLFDRWKSIEAAKVRAKTQYSGGYSGEMLAQTKASIQAELAAAQYGANSKEHIRAVSAEKERQITRDLYRDLEKLQTKFNEGAISKSAFTSASTTVLNNYKQQMIALAPEVERVAKGHKNLFLSVFEGISAYRSIQFAINTVKNTLTSIPKVGIELDSVKASLEATMGSTAGMNSALAALDKEAERTGIHIGILRENFKNFQASTSLAGASLEKTWSMFTNLNTVITGLHLSTDKAQGVFTAMAQIFNKSKVQSEELVKQLGNLLPGAFASFAASMKIFPEELAKRMKAGTVYAQDTMEEFIRYMSNRFTPAFIASQDNLNANWGRLETSVLKFKETVYEANSGILNSTVKTMTEAVKHMTALYNGTEQLSTGAKTLGMVLGGMAAVELAAFITKIISASAALKALEVAFGFLSPQTAVITAVAGAFIYLTSKANESAAAIDAVSKSAREARAERMKGSEQEVKSQADLLRINAELDEKVVKAKSKLEQHTSEYNKLLQAGDSVTVSGMRMTKASDLVKEAKARIDEDNAAIIKARKEASDSLIQHEKDFAKEQAEARVASYDTVIQASRLKELQHTNTMQADLEAVTMEYKDKIAKVRKDAQGDADAVKALEKQLESERKAKADTSMTEYSLGLAKSKDTKAQEAILAVEKELAIRKAEIQEQYAKKGESAAKSAKAAMMRETREEIAVLKEYAGTSHKIAQDKLNALESTNKAQILSFEEFANRKKAILREDYQTEVKFYEDQRELAVKSGNKQLIVSAEEKLKQLRSDFESKSKVTDDEKEAKLNDLNTKLGQIHQKYQDILGIERDSDEVTGSKLVKIKKILEAEIAQHTENEAQLRESLKEVLVTAEADTLRSKMFINDKKLADSDKKHEVTLNRINELQSAGLISEWAAMTRVTEERGKQISDLEDYIKLQKKAQEEAKDDIAKNLATEKIDLATQKLEILKLTADVVGTHFETVLSSAFESSFDGLITKSMTAQQAFKNFTNSVLQDIARIIASEMRSQLLQGLLKPLMGMGISSLGGAIGGGFGGALGKYGSKMTEGTWAATQNADGGVYSGKGISSYSGTIVDKPTLFPFAKGTGLMGEAGAEAILPLKRNRQGKLGVILENSGHSGSNVYNVTVNVSNKQGENPEQFGQRTAQAIMRSIAKEEIANAKRPGNSLNKSRFG